MTPSRIPRTTVLQPSRPKIDAESISLPRIARNALEQIEFAAGGRDSFVDTLGLATLDKRQQFFLDLLSDPARKFDSIADIAKAAGVTPAQIIDLYRSASFAHAHAVASTHLQASLPAVVQDIAEKSVDAKVECPTCFGTGFSGGASCLNCDGRGLIFRASDLDRQKLVLEATGVVKKGQGVNVNVNQQVGIVQPGSFFSKWVKNSDQAAYDIQAIDAESTEESQN